MSDITITSTTDSAEEIVRAIGGDPAQAVVEPPVAAPAAEPAAPEKPVEGAPAPEGQPDAVPAKPAAAAVAAPAQQFTNEEAELVALTKGVESPDMIRNFKRQTRQKWDAIRKAQTLEAEVARLRQSRPPAEPKPEEGAGGKPVADAVAAAVEPTRPKPVAPKADDFEDVDAYDVARDKYVEDVAEWHAEQKVARAEAEREHRTRQAAVSAAWEERVAQSRTLHPDFDEVVQAGANLPTDGHGVMQRAFLERPLGSEMYYFLLTAPQLCEQIAEICDKDPASGTYELGRLEAHIDFHLRQAGVSVGASTTPSPPKAPAADGAAKPASDAPAAPVAAPPVAAASGVSKAPPPITPVGGGGAGSSVKLDELPYQEYNARRTAEERARAGR